MYSRYGKANIIGVSSPMDCSKAKKNTEKKDKINFFLDKKKFFKKTGSCVAIITMGRCNNVNSKTNYTFKD